MPPLEVRGDAPVQIVSEQESAAGGATVDAGAGADTVAAGGDAEGQSAAVANNPSAGSGGDAGVRDGPASSSVQEGSRFIGGVWYWIRRGDTLWGISSSFYRNPWYYGRIAEENRIRNPDLIYAGSKIFIPEQK